MIEDTQVKEVISSIIVTHVFDNVLEYGTAGKRAKIHYKNIEDLKKQMDELMKEGLID